MTEETFQSFLNVLLQTRESHALDNFTANILHRSTVDVNEEPQSIYTAKAVDTLALAGDLSSSAQAAKLQEINHFGHVHF